MGTKTQVYLLGTLHISAVKPTKGLIKTIKSCSAMIEENPRRDHLFNKSNFLAEPLLLIGLGLYDEIITPLLLSIKSLFRYGKETDASSFNRLVNTVNPKIEKHFDFDIDVNKEIKKFHKIYNYPIQALIILTIIYLSIMLYHEEAVDMGLLFIIGFLLYFLYFVFSTINYRNCLAVKGAIELRNKGHTRIIMNYGKLHINGIKQYLLSEGFEVVIINIIK